MELSRNIVPHLLLSASGQKHRCKDHGDLQPLLAVASKLLYSDSRGNKYQCKLLAEKLLCTLNLVQRANISHHERLFHELHGIVSCAAALIDLCESQVDAHSQPYKLISLSQSREAFTLILSNLHWYATAFLLRRDFLGIITQTISDIWHLELREAAREDIKIHAHLTRPIVKEINRHDIEIDRDKKIGQGSFGRVYSATWLGTWPCAVKEFECGTEEIFKKEADVLSRLHHPKIVQFYGCLVDETTSAIVMERMDFDLTYLCQSTELGLDLIVAVDIMLQTAEAMRYVHELNIVHRDLKAANILIKRQHNLGCVSYSVKLTDFGLARTNIQVVDTPWNYDVGTLKWRAPELLQRISEDRTTMRKLTSFFPKKADVYSFGITCSEIVTGRAPYWDLENSMTWTPAAVVREKILQGRRPLLPVDRLPGELVDLIVRCWDEDASRRPGFVAICAELKRIKASLLRAIPAF